MAVRLLNMDNTLFDEDVSANLIYCDMIYEDGEEFQLNSWIPRYWNKLSSGGIFMVQTDWHSIFEVGYFLKRKLGGNHLNHITWKNEFGNFPKNKFRQSHDDILIFSKGNDYKFYPERVQVEKVTAKSKGLNPSGRATKLATSVWTDICLTTVAKERVKKDDGKSIRWQKPITLIDRLFSPFTDDGDLVIDPFLGSGTSGEWCKNNNRDFIGIEKYEDVFELAYKRIFGS